MLKIENVVTPSPEQWRAVIMGARNPMNSWNRSDSQFEETADFDPEDYGGFEIGTNDHDLLMRLRNAGTDHRKFMRMLTVHMDVTAPLYWLAELDTYKVGVVRNSCSFMHKGVTVPYGIKDFSLKDPRIYDVLDDLEVKKYVLKYPYETDEYKRYFDLNGRGYRVYRNGRVIREAFDYVDAFGKGRKRHFEESEATVYQNKGGYFVVKFSGRGGGQKLLHRLVADCWLDKPEWAYQVDHKDTDKGNNSVENLEWVTASENMQRAVDSGLYDNLKSLHRRYKAWKNSSTIIGPEKRLAFKQDVEKGLTYTELASKYKITPTQANNVRSIMKNSENEDLFQECFVWERLINCLNSLRELYLETKDEAVFQQIRSLMPQGYMQRSTYMMNYEVLANIYKSRKGHRLDEWESFREWIRTLPYSELITGEE